MWPATNKHFWHFNNTCMKLPWLTARINFIINWHRFCQNITKSSPRCLLSKLLQVEPIRLKSKFILYLLSKWILWRYSNIFIWKTPASTDINCCSKYLNFSQACFTIYCIIRMILTNSAIYIIFLFNLHSVVSVIC